MPPDAVLSVGGIVTRLFRMLVCVLMALFVEVDLRRHVLGSAQHGRGALIVMGTWLTSLLCEAVVCQLQVAVSGYQRVV